MAVHAKLQMFAEIFRSGLTLPDESPCNRLKRKRSADLLVIVKKNSEKNSRTTALWSENCIH